MEKYKAATGIEGEPAQDLADAETPIVRYSLITVDLEVGLPRTDFILKFLEAIIKQRHLDPLHGGENCDYGSPEIP